MQRLTSIYIGLLLTVFLFAFGPGGYVTIGQVKYQLFLLICGGYVISSILLRTQMALTGTQPIGNFRQKLKGLSMPEKLLFAFLFFTIISALLSDFDGVFRGEFRQEGVLTITIYVLCTLFLSRYFRPQKWMLYLFGSSVTFVSVLAFVQLTGANPFGLYPAGLNYYDSGTHYVGEFLSTLGNAGLFGGFLSLAVGVLAMAIIKLETNSRWLLAIPLFTAVLLIFSMGINAAVLAVLVGFVIMLPVAMRTREGLDKKGLMNTLAVFGICLLTFLLSRVLTFYDGGVLLGFVTHEAQNGMFWEAAQILQGNIDDTFGTRRIFIWRNVIENLHWGILLFGTGPDTLGFWPIPPFTRYIPEIGVMNVTIIDAAHNEYLHILATNGLLALLSYLGALVYSAVKWLRFPDNPIAAMMGAGVLLYCIQAFFGISQCIVAPFFWACFAMLINAQNKNLSNSQVV